MTRRRAIGAEAVDGGVHFRVWAPARTKVAVVIDGRDHPLERETSGHFSGVVSSARAGTRYRFRLDGEGETYPDPASRYQPEGPHGASEVCGRGTVHGAQCTVHWDPKDLVISEIHIGTFTPGGTFLSAIEKLPQVAGAGINMLEVMPVNEFPGRFGWGYDGVDWFAPAHVYGTPDDFRRFVAAAHRQGVGVILDVVYNHFGPDGCYWSKFTPDYFTKRYSNDWGEAINFESDGVRELCAENAAYWIDEFGLDGLRLDATQDIHDPTDPHILADIARAARAAAGDRAIFIVAENEGQNCTLIREYGVDALWNDDWHHSALVAFGREPEAYYSDYRGTPQELVSMAKHAFLYQGQWYSWQKKHRGTPTGGIDAHRFVCYLENHDQVANSATGERTYQLTSLRRYRALAALLLLGPETPMLFQGQEFESSKPFLYFADHEPELAAAVRKGRREFLAQFPSVASIADTLAPPEDVATFARCKLDWSERETNREALTLHRELIELRRAYSTELADGAVLGDHALVLRYADDRLLIVNLGDELDLDPVNEPLLAPPLGCEWSLLWSSSNDGFEEWLIPAESAIVLRPTTPRSQPSAAGAPGR
ncbi:MAG TPA: malto-oligosyltrehalose trehalohydrolase [Thermoanaerobaculia bacterium]|nr:malto-oligosyltrehalose trehalohydrolase [Thermoanaerobaculia bacterium]